MKKAISLILIVCLLFTFAGCRKKPTPSTPTDGISGNNTPQASAPNNQNATVKPLIAVSVPAVTENTVKEDGTLLFQYTYQHMSLVLDKPDVADKVILDFLNRVDSTKEAADATAEMAKQYYNSNSWVPYLYHITYSPTRIDENVLSLFGNNVVFTATTHPDRTCVSASYDLQTGDILTLASIMAKDATTEQICNLVLDGLKELAEGDYLYEGYQQTVKQRFQIDASTDEAWYLTTTGLCFYFAPYEIAPYASGVISVEIPYEKLGSILHEEYIPEKINATTGNVTVSDFNAEGMSDIDHIAEIVVNNDGKMHIIQTDGIIQDVKVLQTDSASNYTIFAANMLCADDGIMLQAADGLLKNLKLSYKSGDETQVKPLG